MDPQSQQAAAAFAQYAAYQAQFGPNASGGGGDEQTNWVPPPGWVAPPGWAEYQQFLVNKRSSQQYAYPPIAPGMMPYPPYGAYAPGYAGYAAHPKE
jgi:hypothetical protein